jgi:hypothetical protein
LEGPESLLFCAARGYLFYRSGGPASADNGCVPWTVSAYENSEIPEPRWLDAGTFDTAAEAIACANGIIRKLLLELYEVNRKANADGLLTGC